MRCHGTLKVFVTELGITNKRDDIRGVNDIVHASTKRYNRRYFCMRIDHLYHKRPCVLARSLNAVYLGS